MAQYVPDKQEASMLEMFANGFTKKDIAEKLQIPYNRCLRIFRNICKGYNAKNMTHCIILALKGGVI